MSIFTKAWKKVIRPVGNAAISVVEFVAPKAIAVVDLVAPTKVKHFVNVTSRAVSLAKTFITGDSQMEKTATEQLIRAIYTGINDSIGQKPIMIMGNLIPIMGLVSKAADEFNNKTVDEVAETLRSALDNMIGNEDDALLGEKGAILSGDIPFVSNEFVEQASDVMIGIISKQMAKQIVGPDSDS